jgi:MOSC domain-containing protein YiiM
VETVTGKVLSVNVGGIRHFDYEGHKAMSAIWKLPVVGRVMAQGVNLAGDDQADREAHGGVDKAIYAYAVEDQRWWEGQIGRPLAYGEVGENLTTEGIDVTHAIVGERWEVGNALLEVSEPRIPCWRLGVRMGDKHFPRLFTKAGRPGTYLRILKAGDIGAGDVIRIMSRPDHDLSIGDVFRIFVRDRHEATRLLPVPQLSAAWKEWAASQAGKATDPAENRTPGCC